MSDSETVHYSVSLDDMDARMQFFVQHSTVLRKIIFKIVGLLFAIAVLGSLLMLPS